MPTLSVDLLASGFWVGRGLVQCCRRAWSLLLLQRRAAAQALLAMQACLLDFTSRLWFPSPNLPIVCVSARS